MKARIQITIETDLGQHVDEMACWERQAHRLEDIGLTLAESKCLLAAIQKILVEHQVTEYLDSAARVPARRPVPRKEGEPYG
jgi:hypothetical protein